MFPIVSPIFLHPVAHVVYLSPCSLPFVHHPPLKIIYSMQRITRDNKIPQTKSKCMVITISKVTLGDGSIRISLVLLLPGIIHNMLQNSRLPQLQHAGTKC